VSIGVELGVVQTQDGEQLSTFFVNLS